MKKTLLTLSLLAALGASASEFSLEDATLSQSQADDTLVATSTLDSGLSAYTISGQLNVQKLADTLVNGNTTAGAAYTFFSMTGVSGTTQYNVGVATGYSSSGGKINSIGLHTITSQASSTSTDVPTDYRNISPVGSPDMNYLGTVDWSHVLEAALTLVHTTGGSGHTEIYLTLGYDNGSIVNYAGSDSALHWTGEAAGTILNVNTRVMDSIYVMSGAATQAQALELNAQLIPEPATATLSLLALAGLAARRRRR